MLSFELLQMLISSLGELTTCINQYFEQKIFELTSWD